MAQPLLRGLDPEKVTPWLRANVPGAEGELGYELVAAGGSNLTYRVESVASGQRYALRRPPERARIASAHDMSREWKILKALSSHPDCGVPVPEALAFCDDTSLLGAEFYVMGFADGRILRDTAAAADLSPAQARAATSSLVDVNVALHRMDVDRVGLGDLGRREAYALRQLARWRKQYETVKSRELPLVEEVHRKLAARVPKQQATSLVHGDYRFDNTVMDADFRIIAVLDWELATLGDPVADFAWSIMYWSDPEDAYDFGSPAPSRNAAFPRRREVIELYAKRSGFDLSPLDYFVAFSWWKMACLVEGVVARIAAGAGGGLAERGSDIAATRRRVEQMLENAAAAAPA
jgi:aminoglycoside phosphotransferase (APT) family kinase protein